MASLKRKTIIRYLDKDGNRVAKGTPGARKVKEKSSKWYGSYTDANGLPQCEPLSANKTAAQQMLADLVKRAELGRSGIVDPFEEHASKALTQHVDDFEQYLKSKGNGVEHVRTTSDRVRAAVAGCGWKRIADIRPSSLATWLAERRKGSVLPSGDVIRGISIGTSRRRTSSSSSTRIASGRWA